MTSELILFLFLGHCVGDYLLQSGWMALNKQKYSVWGWLAAFFHCLEYSLVVTIFLTFAGLEYSWKLYGLIFFSHFIIDKFPVVNWWFVFVGARSWDTQFKKSQMKRWGEVLWGVEPRAWDIPPMAFGAIVYTVADNTFHFLLMVGGLYLFILPDYVEVMEVMIDGFTK